MTEQTGQIRPTELSLPSNRIPVITPNQADGASPLSVSSNSTPSSLNDLPDRESILTTPHLSCLQQILLFLLVLFLSSGFLLAWKLEPSPQGYGTHQQLGFPPCSIQILFGVPCPSCGMTTSFAWYVRGQIGQAWQANPAGLYLAILCSLLIPWSLISICKKTTWKIRRPDIVAVVLTTGFVGLACLQWAVRYFSATW